METISEEDEIEGNSSLFAASFTKRVFSIHNDGDKTSSRCVIIPFRPADVFDIHFELSKETQLIYLRLFLSPRR